MIPAFKKPVGCIMSGEQTYFNCKLASIRVKSKHCIGLLKTRFQYLKGIRSKMKKKRHLRKVIRHITRACILHNLLISEPAPDEWQVDIQANGRSDLDLSADDELSMPVINASDGEGQRHQLLAYLLELRG